MTANRDNANSRYYRTHERFIDGLIPAWVSPGNGLNVSAGASYIPGLGRNCIQNAPSTLSLSNLSLTANAWYYLYLFENNGVPTLELVTIAPVSYSGTARTKTGDNTRRFLAALKTNSSGALYNFQWDPSNAIHYKASLNTSPFRAFSGTLVNSPSTQVSLSGVVPITSQIAYAMLNNVGNGSDIYMMNPDNSEVDLIRYASGSASPDRVFIKFPTSSGQQIWLRGAASATGTLDVTGYGAER